MKKVLFALPLLIAASLALMLYLQPGHQPAQLPSPAAVTATPSAAQRTAETAPPTSEGRPKKTAKLVKSTKTKKGVKPARVFIYALALAALGGGGFSVYDRIKKRGTT